MFFFFYLFQWVSSSDYCVANDVQNCSRCYKVHMHTCPYLITFDLNISLCSAGFEQTEGTRKSNEGKTQGLVLFLSFLSHLLFKCIYSIDYFLFNAYFYVIFSHKWKYKRDELLLFCFLSHCKSWFIAVLSIKLVSAYDQKRTFAPPF